MLCNTQQNILILRVSLTKHLHLARVSETKLLFVCTLTSLVAGSGVLIPTYRRRCYRQLVSNLKMAVLMCSPISIAQTLKHWHLCQCAHFVNCQLSATTSRLFRSIDCFISVFAWWCLAHWHFHERKEMMECFFANKINFFGTFAFSPGTASLSPGTVSFTPLILTPRAFFTPNRSHRIGLFPAHTNVPPESSPPPPPSPQSPAKQAKTEKYYRLRLRLFRRVWSLFRQVWSIICQGIFFRKYGIFFATSTFKLNNTHLTAHVNDLAGSYRAHPG